MFSLSLIGWILLRFTNPEVVRFYAEPGLPDVNTRLVNQWSSRWCSFVFIVDDDPGDKWSGGPEEIVYYLGLCWSAEAVLKQFEKKNAEVFADRNDRKVNPHPEWICFVLV